ncbi:Phage repressor protein C, contains Cro/C1-type HTH and peptisase s24 domains [Brevinema andersonii]|uniref:Phage repressor protein C, contains Cro/C1-type HTH and peptisase s24 domains n=1 Tax=Brevinema andersonii TaxID=34097 RepID=A0A1I1ETS9_BREAD|nr:helix-turn-helix transcriptional regulator [Brevinema andersonii]SFB88303.1 Phage repressor protein C, contains Cro/C1-type HTH and peptisase s24 domains [Brevinema andersonii]
MSVGKRLRQARKEKGITQVKLCEILDIPQSNLARYENDRGHLTYEKLDKISKIGINIEWLITGKGEMFRSGGETGVTVTNNNTELAKTEKKDVVKIPLLDVKASAGLGLINYQEEIKDYIGIPIRFLGGYLPKSVALLFASGDSMEPVIQSGDLLLVSPNDKELISDSIYILRVFDELRVKKLIRRVNGNILIKSENPNYGSEEILPTEWEDNNIEIVARVIRVIRSIEAP